MKRRSESEEMLKVDKLWQNVSTHAILTRINIKKGREYL